LATAIGGIAGGRAIFRRSSTVATLVMPVIAAICVGTVVALLTWCAHGALGPGRLAEVGSNPVLVGAVVALELAFGMTLGIFARKVDLDRLAQSRRIQDLLGSSEREREDLHPLESEHVRLDEHEFWTQHRLQDHGAEIAPTDTG